MGLAPALADDARRRSGRPARAGAQPPGARTEYFNDHLHEGRDRVRSDLGFVRAQVLLR